MDVVITPQQAQNVVQTAAENFNIQRNRIEFTGDRVILRGSIAEAVLIMTLIAEAVSHGVAYTVVDTVIKLASLANFEIADPGLAGVFSGAPTQTIWGVTLR